VGYHGGARGFSLGRIRNLACEHNATVEFEIDRNSIGGDVGRQVLPGIEIGPGLREHVDTLSVFGRLPVAGDLVLAVCLRERRYYVGLRGERDAGERLYGLRISGC